LDYSLPGGWNQGSGEKGFEICPKFKGVVLLKKRVYVMTLSIAGVI
jgi:hypothetical protein